MSNYIKLMKKKYEGKKPLRPSVQVLLYIDKGGDQDKHI